jgi:hypothetical protein
VTRHQLHGPRFRRVFPDVYVPAGADLSLLNRSLAAFELVRDRGGVLGGYSAAVLLGADCAPGDAPAEVLVPHRVYAHRGLRVRRDCVAKTDVREAGGVLVTTPIRTAWDLARRLPLVEGVVAVDALARRGCFAPADLLKRRTGQHGARGCRRLDAVVTLSDPRAESPPETRLRLGLVRAGLPPPEVQFRVIDEYGYTLARLDLAYPEAKLAIEYDGAVHFERRRAIRDRQRDAELAGYGWLTLRLTPDDLFTMPQTTHRIRDLLAIRRP